MTREECVALLYRYAEYDGIGIPNLIGCKVAMRMAADLLFQLPLSSNIDEAAQEYAYNNFENNDYHTGANEGLPFDAIGYAEKCFKAGAEWMAGQGETLNSLIWRDEDDKLFIEAFVDENKFKMAENVTIQIRKKQ